MTNFLIIGCLIAIFCAVDLQAQQQYDGSTDTSQSGEINDCNFKYGIGFTSNQNDTVYNQFDYLTIWIVMNSETGKVEFIENNQGEMIRTALRLNKVPVFYTYIYAALALADWGLRDCDVSPSGWNLCTNGAEYIRQNRDKIVSTYYSYMQSMSLYLPSDSTPIFLMETDSVQFYSGTTQANGALSGPYMAALFDDCVKAIKSYFPNAKISWDISPWLDQDNMKIWWNFFNASSIDYINRSDGRSTPDLEQIDENCQITWSFMHYLTNKQIFADCGYGVGGNDENNCYKWNNSTSIANRINDGVIGAFQYTYQYAPSIKASVCNVPYDSPFSSTQPTLSECTFQYGIGYNGDSYDNSYASVDFITIFLDTFNGYYQGGFINLMQKLNKVPVFYLAVISSLKNNLNANSLTDSQFLTSNYQDIINTYSQLASNMSMYTGQNGNVLLVMDDIWGNFKNDPSQGTPSASQLGETFHDVVKAIKSWLPQAQISLKVYPYFSQSDAETFWASFQPTDIDFVHMLFGNFHAESTNIDGEWSLTWSFISQLTGKKIFIDCGYGDKSLALCLNWNNSDNLHSRLNDGVIALAQGPAYSDITFQPSNRPSVC